MSHPACELWLLPNDLGYRLGYSYNNTEGFDEEAIAETLDDDERVEFFETYYDELLKAIK